MRTVRLPSSSTFISLLVIGALVGGGTLACDTSARPPKVIVVGLDGLSWSFLEPLLEAETLPHLAHVLEDAAFGELETFRPTRSAILWTSVATGKTLDKHGITDWTYVDDDARREIEQLRLQSGIDRTASTVWEILGDSGFSVSVVNWWVTYPARPVNGTLVTDRLKLLMNDASIAEEPDLVYPPSAIDELRPMFRHPGQLPELLSRYDFPSYSPEAAEQMFRSNQAGRTLFESLGSYVGQDRMVADWALHLLERDQPDFFAVVLRLTDVYAHLAWRFDVADLDGLTRVARPEHLTHTDTQVRETALDAVAEVDRVIAETLAPAYRFADEFLGALTEVMDPDSLLVIVSDHGFSWNGSSYSHNPNRRVPYPDASPPGVIVMKGPGIRPGRIEGADLFDVAPTVLYALGMPTARDMDGRALLPAFDGGWSLGGPRDEEFVDSYGVPPAQDAFPFGPAEQQLLDDLRGLGYIRGGSSAAPPPDDSTR